MPSAMTPNHQVSLTLSTHNVMGLDRNKKYIRSLCKNNSNSIRAFQEHWLKPPSILLKKRKNKNEWRSKLLGVNLMRIIHSKFDSYATSAMSKSKKIKGRP